jgi:subtilase family serine protease
VIRRRIRTTAITATATAAVATAGVVAITGSTPPNPPVQARLQAAADASDSGVLSLAWARAQAKAGAHVNVTTKAAGESIDHPLLPSECITRYGTPCYGPTQLRHLYGLDKLGLRAGAGRTVALIMPGFDPVLRSDLEVYSKQTGLPAPKLTVVKDGNPKELDPNDFVQAITAEELELDAEMIHTTAPAARIVYLATERDNANEIDNFGGTIDSIAKLSGHHIDAVSLSYGWFELNYAEKYGADQGAALIRAQAAGLATAARNRMTVVSANGDTGPTGPNLAGDALYSQQTAAFIAASPLVTGVAGSELHADDQGNRTSPDTVWSEHDNNGVATGGALSQVFDRPSYQDGARSIVGTHRGNSDIAMDGSVASRVWMYTSRYQVLSGQAPGWVRTAGTSAASPLFAGIVADAAQVAGHPLGLINPALYMLAATPASRNAAGIADITSGCNTIAGVVQGSCGGPGYDLASGIGTVRDASWFVPALARAAGASRVSTSTLNAAPAAYWLPSSTPTRTPVGDGDPCRIYFGSYC